MLEISPKDKIIAGVNYFSRKIFAKIIKTNEAVKNIRFIKYMNGNIIMNNGQEFNNNELREWAEKNNVEIQYALTYNNMCNGMVKRTNRTISEALKNTLGSVKQKLQTVIHSYKNMKH